MKTHTCSTNHKSVHVYNCAWHVRTTMYILHTNQNGRPNQKNLHSGWFTLHLAGFPLQHDNSNSGIHESLMLLGGGNW